MTISFVSVQGQLVSVHTDDLRKPSFVKGFSDAARGLHYKDCPYGNPKSRDEWQCGHSDYYASTPLMREAVFKWLEKRG